VNKNTFLATNADVKKAMIKEHIDTTVTNVVITVATPTIVSFPANKRYVDAIKRIRQIKTTSQKLITERRILSIRISIIVY
jgi:hypothetical protein